MFRALVCDYDGTIATHDVIAPPTLAALVRAREAGLSLVLATGRTFFELTRVCERLDLFDAVVAENGGVLYLPRARMIRDQAPPPPARLLAELDRRGIHYQRGRVIVGTARSDEQRVQEALAATGVRLARAYNRAALMLLPEGISKGSGVSRAIRTLGLSAHDVLGLGDAENDLELFAACGWTGCPADAVAVLRERADWVFPGEDGEAIARAITAAILPRALPLERPPRHRVHLGWVVGTAEPLMLPERGANVLVHGDPLSGKSWFAGVLVERLHARGISVCVIDPEGDYLVLGRLPGATWTEVHDRAQVDRAVRHFDHDPAACVVVDLSRLSAGARTACVETALLGVGRLRQRLGRPHWVVLDEAHASAYGVGGAGRAARLDDKGICLVTYRVSALREAVLWGMDCFVLGRTTEPRERAALAAHLARRGGPAAAMDALAGLATGELLALQPDGLRGLAATTFVPTPRETPHVRHLRKYADARVSEADAFVFRRPDGTELAVADSLAAFRREVARVEDESLAFHARRRDFSRWVRDVFSDRVLAGQLHKAEVRWARGELTSLRDAVDRMILVRYGP